SLITKASMTASTKKVRASTISTMANGWNLQAQISSVEMSERLEREQLCGATLIVESSSRSERYRGGCFRVPDQNPLSYDRAGRSRGSSEVPDLRSGSALNSRGYVRPTGRLATSRQGEDRGGQAEPYGARQRSG